MVKVHRQGSFTHPAKKQPERYAEGYIPNEHQMQSAPSSVAIMWLLVGLGIDCFQSAEVKTIS